VALIIFRSTVGLVVRVDYLGLDYILSIHSGKCYTRYGYVQ
tara:strand:- start:13016 stop:13138 length:123 start_codon:yes stop_codon:yes gene_type:complete